MKFVSHLDMNRFMSRAVRLARLPVWYTEGFNPHPYLTFALPLSLGFESDYEVMDLRLEQDDFTNRQVKEALSKVLNGDISIIEAADPVMKPGKIAYARFSIAFEPENTAGFQSDLRSFLSLPSIQAEKTGKSGKITTLELATKIREVEVIGEEGVVRLDLTLPAGSSDNLNPALLLETFRKFTGTDLPYHSIRRTALYNAEMELFR